MRRSTELEAWEFIAADRGYSDDARSKGLSRLSTEYLGTKDRRIGRLFAKIVLDESATQELRRLAYALLFHVDGRCLEELPPFAAIRIPDDCDAALLRRYSAWTSRVRGGLHGMFRGRLPEAVR